MRLEMLSQRQGATHGNQGIFLGDNLMHEKEKCDSVGFLGKSPLGLQPLVVSEHP